MVVLMPFTRVNNQARWLSTPFPHAVSFKSKMTFFSQPEIIVQAEILV